MTTLFLVCYWLKFLDPGSWGLKTKAEAVYLPLVFVSFPSFVDDIQTQETDSELQIHLHMYQQFIIEAYSFNRTKKSKQCLICWDMENGEAEKMKSFFLDCCLLRSSLTQ